MKKYILLTSFFAILISFNNSKAQIINPGFETWTNDFLVPTAMNPNSGNNTYGWWDYNYFNYALIGGSPISVTRCNDTVRSGSYSVRLETKVFTPTSWNIYNTWGIPFIGHSYNDTLGILFNGKVDVTTQTFRPGTAMTQAINDFRFYYQYRPKPNDMMECRVSLHSGGALVGGGIYSSAVGTGNGGWQQGVVNITYISGLTPDTMYVLFSSSTLDNAAKAGSVLWIDDASITLPTGIEQQFDLENPFVAYPNPSNGVFSIRMDLMSNLPQRIDIFNSLGEKVSTSTYTNKTTIDVDLSAFPKGIYFLKVYSGENLSTQKVVID